MQKKNIATVVEELLRPVVEDLGYQLWDVEYTKVGADFHLILTIDSEAGIGIEDCEKVHRAVDVILDEADPIETAYRLEVSSPGVERQLRTETHLVASIGQVVEIKTFAAINGEKRFIAVISAYEDGVLTVVNQKDETFSLKRSEISKIGTIFFELEEEKKREKKTKPKKGKKEKIEKTEKTEKIAHETDNANSENNINEENEEKG